MTHDPAAFGRLWAAVYDDVHADLEAEVPPAVDLVVALAGPDRRILELGVGTGRLAIPLARAGLSVVGLDISPQMLEVLAAKPGGELVHAVLGDMVDPPLAGPFDVILVAFNTLLGLPDATAQACSLAAAARLLAPDGRLVVDTAVPQPWRLATTGHDPVDQTITAVHTVVIEGHPVELPLALRYLWPAQQDAMAAATGLAVANRAAEWDGSGDLDAAERLVTVYCPSPTSRP